MAWRLSNFSAAIGAGQTLRFTFSFGGRDVGAQYFMAHPLFVGNELVLSDQTKASVPAIGGGIFYAASVRNASPRPGALTWEGGGFI
jgi:hypothetical protein